MKGLSRYIKKEYPTAKRNKRKTIPLKVSKKYIYNLHLISYYDNDRKTSRKVGGLASKK